MRATPEYSTAPETLHHLDVLTDVRVIYSPYRMHRIPSMFLTLRPSYRSSRS